MARMPFQLRDLREWLTRDHAVHGAIPAEPAVTKDIFLASGIINLLALALPLSILQIYDRVLPNQSFDTLYAFVLGLVCVILIDCVLKYARAHLTNWSAASYTHKTSSEAFKRLLKTSPSRHRRTTGSEHLERLDAIFGVGTFLSGSARIVAIDLMFVPIFAAVILIVGGPLFVIPILLFALFGYFAMRRTARLRDTISEREIADSRKNDFIIETLEAMHTVKALSMEQLMMRRYERLQAEASDIVRRTILVTNAGQTYATLYSSVSTAAIVSFGALLVIYDRLTIGGLACCMLLSSQLLQPLMRILSAWNEVHVANHRRGRVAAIFENTDGLIEPRFDSQPVPERANLSVSNLTFSHDPDTPLFKNIHVSIPAGEFVAVDGEDGSGRSSLLRCLMGMIEPQAGHVAINDIILTPENAQWARRVVRYVGQQPTTFRGTILDNLSIFGRTPTEQCLWAAKLINLDGEIIRMPLGYDTPLGSAASRDIPAATAQRICIARAIATKPAILLLDEPNTSLDMPGEKALVQGLDRLRGQMTIIFATHRPSIIAVADRAYRIKDHALERIEMSRPQPKVQTG